MEVSFELTYDNAAAAPGTAIAHPDTTPGVQAGLIGGARQDLTRSYSNAAD